MEVQEEQEEYVPEYVHFSRLLQMPAPVLYGRLTNDPLFILTTIFDRVRDRSDENFVICPLLVDLILMAIRLGSGTRTGEEIQMALGHTELDRQNVKRTAKALIHRLKDDEIYNFNSAQKIFVGNRNIIHRNFKILSEGVFYLYLELLNFSDPEEASEKINKWVMSSTTSAVHNLVPETLLTEDCKMFIASSVYFRGIWDVEINKTQTTLERFVIKPLHGVQVEFFHTLSVYNYYESEDLDAKFLELPLVKDEGSLVIVLPNKTFGLHHLESRIRAVLSVPEDSFVRKEVRAMVPKFIITTTIDWSDILKELGVRRLFTENEAEIDEIAGEPGELHVNHLLQKIIIRIHERRLGDEPPAPYDTSTIATDFIANHPFLFYVKLRGVIIFIGRLLDPSGSDDLM